MNINNIDNPIYTQFHYNLGVTLRELGKIEEAILGVVGGLDKPGSPAGEAIQAFHSELNGRGKACTEQFRNQVLAVTEADLKRVASTYLREDAAQTAVITNTELAASTNLEIVSI